MDTTETVIKLEPCFKLKGSRVTITLLELYEYDYTTFTQQLAETVKSAPDFFQQTPVIINLERCRTSFIDFIELGELCREYGLVPVAIRGGTEDQQLSANVAGLPLLPLMGTKVPEAPEPKPQAPETRQTMIIDTPVRSGQQVYAEGCDLIVTSSVGAGAEILADGNIHIYGPLRGRALAGVKGNKDARIFCQRLEAELISIAGNYKLNEDLQKGPWKQGIQATLKNDLIIITTLN